jgi:hypothetical protein
MPVSSRVRGMAGRSRRGVGRVVARAAGRAGRQLVAGGLGPVLAVGTSLVPVVVTAGAVAGVTGAAAPAARAATADSALILLLGGETSRQIPDSPRSFSRKARVAERLMT